jgi:hypothetical protein
MSQEQPNPGQSNPAVEKAEPITSIFDHQPALKRLGGDVRLLRELVQFFYEDSDRLVCDLREAVAAGDSDQIVNAAHALKGLTASLSRQTADAAGRVESCDASDSAILGAEMVNLETRLRLLKGELAALGYAPLDRRGDR